MGTYSMATKLIQNKRNNPALIYNSITIVTIVTPTIKLEKVLKLLPKKIITTTFPYSKPKTELWIRKGLAKVKSQTGMKFGKSKKPP
jgi:hypothetical protein